MKFITWDTGIVAAFAILLAYSLLIRKHKSLATLVSVYIAYVMASTWGDAITAYLSGDRVVLNQVWIKANASPLLVQSLLMVLVALLLSAFLKLGGRRSKYSAVEVMAYTVSATALTIMFIISFMTPEQLAHTLTISRLVPYIYKWRQIILVVPVFVMVFFGIYGNEEN
jgi:hypothetical protein